MRRKAALFSALLVVYSTLFAGPAALAHDEVVSVMPEAGSTVEAGVIDLNITFSEEVLTTDGSTGFEIAVTNEKGEKQEVGCLSPMGASLSARTIAAEAGEYTVAWHSVSNDGHPAEGTYKFTVSGRAGEMIPSDELQNCPRLLIAPAPLDDPSAIAYSTGTDAVANDNTPVEVGILIFVVLLVLGAAIWVTKKRKR
ncbi:MAG: copper resistance protein CopC [Micrococcales bacterium]